MWRAALRHSLNRLPSLCLILAVLAPILGALPASAATKPRSPIWAIALPDGSATATQSQLTWLAARGVTSIVTVRAPAASLRRLVPVATRAKLTVIVPQAKTPSRACAVETRTLRTCASLVDSPAKAVVLAQRSLVDYVVIRIRTPLQLRMLRGSGATRTRIIAVLGSEARDQASWAAGIRYALKDPALDLAIGSAPAQSGRLSSYLSLLPRKTTATATDIPDAPASLVVGARTATSMTLAWTAPPGQVSSYAVYSDETLVHDVATTSIALTGLSCNHTYTFAVEAIGDAGAHSPRATAVGSTDVCAASGPTGGGGGGSGGTNDAIPPSSPLALVANSASQSSIAVSWLAASDNVGVTGYELFRNGSPAGASTITNFVFPGLACGTSYALGVEAYDAAGNYSGRTSLTAATAACPPGADSVPPTAPGSLAKTSSTTTSISVAWSASSDNVGVVGYGRYSNGALLTGGAGTSYVFAGLVCGTSYTLAVDAYDAAGNRSGRSSSLGAATAACAAPPAGGAANLWVDASGGSCVRQASAGGYQDAQACSWAAAYQAAQTGDLILVKGGSYGNVTMGANKPSIGAPGVTYRTASGETVTVNDFENGYIGASVGASNVSFEGPVSARTFRSDGASNVVVDGWRVDCGGCDNIQIFHIENGSNVLVRNSDISDNQNNSLIWINGTNLTFENNVIHDAALPNGSASHTECMYVWDVTNLTLKRNHFYHCSVMDVFITGSDVSSGGYIENNVFEKPWENTGVISNSAYAFHFRTGGSPSPNPTNWDFRYNTFIGPLSVDPSENPVGAGGMRVIGNLFLSGSPCGQANTTYAYNAFVSAPCGTNSITNSLGTYQSGFNSTGDPGDYSLTSASALRDRGSTGSYPSSDRSGVSRYVGSAPDLGAYEYR